VPYISVAAELLSMWFDDLYIPEDAFFRSCFSQEELSALVVFDDYFEKHEELLPMTTNGIVDWLQNEVWQGIMREAAKALSVVQASAPHGCNVAESHYPSGSNKCPSTRSPSFGRSFFAYCKKWGAARCASSAASSLYCS